MTAEQIRRSGDPATAIDLCRDALARFPGHLSARVTLGWALLDLGRLQEAREEFQVVRHSAPDNFAAIRGLAQLHVLEENDSSYTPDLGATHEPPAPMAAAPPSPARPVVAAAAAVAPVAPEPVAPEPAPVPAVVPVVTIPPMAAVAPPAPQPVAALHVPSPSPVVMRLEAWLSRVEALRAAV